ncbi:MAG: GntR family transcriptional regulator [Butyrivibrio sp.]|nr:GntR family transcriptional regulator [Muribaculum sp.]MCM1551538.1 GntR family transcriptional regulator [Butyrivibrio sp.]
MIVIDYRDKRPLYEQVAEKLAHLIICGAFESNTKLPSVRSLAMDLSVNPNTIQRAYTQLEQEGYIYTVVGRGNYVTDSQEWRAKKLFSLKQELSSLIVRAKETGMSREDILAIVEQTYAEGNTLEQPDAGEEENHD